MSGYNYFDFEENPPPRNSVLMYRRWHLVRARERSDRVEPPAQLDQLNTPPYETVAVAGDAAGFKVKGTDHFLGIRPDEGQRAIRELLDWEFQRLTWNDVFEFTWVANHRYWILHEVQYRPMTFWERMKAPARDY